MNDVESIAVKILDECVTRIRANMAMHYRTSEGERWINASGRSSDAFKVEQVGGISVRLVYSGDDVAPFDTIQYGTKGIPPIAVIKRWQKDKGLEELNPWAIRTNMKTSGGSERLYAPQDWIVNDPVLEAVRQLKNQIPAAAVRSVRAAIFGQN